MSHNKSLLGDVFLSVIALVQGLLLLVTGTALLTSGQVSTPPQPSGFSAYDYVSESKVGLVSYHGEDYYIWKEINGNIITVPASYSNELGILRIEKEKM